MKIIISKKRAIKNSRIINYIARINLLILIISLFTNDKVSHIIYIISIVLSVFTVIFMTINHERIIYTFKNKLQ